MKVFLPNTDKTCHCNAANIPMEDFDELEEGFLRLRRSDTSTPLRKYLPRQIYRLVRTQRTKLGANFLDVVRVGLKHHDAPIGALIPDQYAYDTFKPFFDPYLEDRHFGFDSNDTQPDVYWGDWRRVHSVDPQNKYLQYISVAVCRNIDGFRFMPTITPEELLKVEEKIINTLYKLPGEYKGDYEFINCIPPERKTVLEDDFCMFNCGDKYSHTGNLARFWSYGRGLFVNENHRFVVWVNAKDHLRVISQEWSGNLQKAYRRIANLMPFLDCRLNPARHKRLGFLTVNPDLLGCAMTLSAIIKMVGGPVKEVEDVAKIYHMQIWTLNEDYFLVTGRSRLGDREIDVIKDFQHGLRELLYIISSLEKREEMEYEGEFGDEEGEFARGTKYEKRKEEWDEERDERVEWGEYTDGEWDESKKGEKGKRTQQTIGSKTQQKESAKAQKRRDKKSEKKRREKRRADEDSTEEGAADSADERNRSSQEKKKVRTQEKRRSRDRKEEAEGTADRGKTKQQSGGPSAQQKGRIEGKSEKEPGSTADERGMSSQKKKQKRRADKTTEEKVKSADDVGRKTDQQNREEGTQQKKRTEGKLKEPESTNYERKKGDRAQSSKLDRTQQNRGDISQQKTREETQNDRGDEKRKRGGDEAQKSRGEGSQKNRGEGTQKNKGEGTEKNRGEETEKNRGEGTEKSSGDRTEKAERAQQNKGERAQQNKGEKTQQNKGERVEQNKEEKTQQGFQTVKREDVKSSADGEDVTEQNRGMRQQRRKAGGTTDEEAENTTDKSVKSAQQRRTHEKKDDVTTDDEGESTADEGGDRTKQNTDIRQQKTKAGGTTDEDGETTPLIRVEKVKGEDPKNAKVTQTTELRKNEEGMTIAT